MLLLNLVNINFHIATENQQIDPWNQKKKQELLYLIDQTFIIL